MSDIEVRRATPDDAETIAAFNVAMAAETEDRRLERAVVGRGVTRVLNEPRLGVYYVAELDGRVVGQLLITDEFSDWRDGVFWWIQSVYVEPAARRRGVFRALHEHVARVAGQRGEVCGLRLYVDRGNELAQRVYRELGLRATEYELYEADWSAGCADEG